MEKPLPILAVALGVGGLIPFIACGLAALGQDGERAAMALAAYGAVILAFIGAVHWGLALQDPLRRAERERLTLGVMPALVGWVALLVALAIRVDAGLLILLVGVLGTTIVEARADRAGLIPRFYMTLRYGLSAAVVAILALVLLLRALGAHVAVW